MKTLPEPLLAAIEALQKLPGVGPRSAERFGYYLARNDPSNAKAIASSLAELHEQLDVCPVTFALIEQGQSVSPLYSDASRDKTVIAVVADPFDITALESTNQFKGTYHVLGGLISPLDGVGPEQLHINELLSRLKKDKVKEIILATNASVEGESTALYIQQQLKEKGSKTKLTRLARGLPIGVDLSYADSITLTRALEGRQKLQP